jgi:hypothetical protein
MCSVHGPLQDSLFWILLLLTVSHRPVFRNPFSFRWHTCFQMLLGEVIPCIRHEYKVNPRITYVFIWTRLQIPTDAWNCYLPLISLWFDLLVLVQVWLDICSSPPLFSRSDSFSRTWSPSDNLTLRRYIPVRFHLQHDKPPPPHPPAEPRLWIKSVSRSGF